MENASKALIMAGSVLISVLLITGLVFMFSSISNLQSTEADSEEVKKLAEFNKKIERYNESVLYGSEILSLCNLIEDYNKESLIADGYDKIEFTINLEAIAPATRKIMIEDEYPYEELLEAYRKLEEKIKTSGESNALASYSGVPKKTAKEISGMRDSEIENYLIKHGVSSYDIYSIRQRAQEYVDYNQEMITFKNKKFSRVTFEYNENNGRVSKIIYKA